MRVCVLGQWHLGTVTAGCLASLGHDVVGLDFDSRVVADLAKGVPPIFEPGLENLINSGLSSGRLRFTSSIEVAAGTAEVLWVACDTPVDDDDVADVKSVVDQIERVLPKLPAGALVLVSSQLPVGSIRGLEALAAEKYPGKPLQFACMPENLRLGKALDGFLKPDRIVVGLRSGAGRDRLESLFLPITDRIEWMSIESAEMTKHAINSFFAASVTFANEIAAICELVGADAKEVERGLKTESRIGAKAYLSPGGAFAGGTLARDIVFLNRQAKAKGLATPLLSAVKPSNDAHAQWLKRKIQAAFPNLVGTTVAIWGLTYKPGTDTLRRSVSVELCDWLLAQGAAVRVHDPAVKSLPDHWFGKIRRYEEPVAAVLGAQALVVGTEWPDYQKVSAGFLVERSDSLTLFDPNRFLRAFAEVKNVRYMAVGSPEKVWSAE